MLPPRFQPEQGACPQQLEDAIAADRKRRDQPFRLPPFLADQQDQPGRLPQPQDQYQQNNPFPEQ